MDDLRWFASNGYTSLLVPELRRLGLAVAAEGDRPARVAVAMSGRTAEAAWRFARAHRARLVVYVWDLPPKGTGRGRYDPVFQVAGRLVRLPRPFGGYRRHRGSYSRLRYIAARAEAVWVPSEMTRAILADRFGVASRRLPYCYDSNRFVPAAGPRASPPTLLTVSRLRQHKNQAAVLGAAARLGREVEVRLIGRGPEHDRLQALARRLGVRCRIETDADDAAVARAYHEASVAVCPSRFEGFGLTPVEAVASGTPVVASDISPHRESVGGVARLVPLDDESALVAAIGQALEGTPARSGAGTRARHPGRGHAIPGRPRAAARPAAMSRHLLLTYDFPPIGGGIARMMGELAKRYPPGSLLVSTGSCPGSASSDAALPNPVDRVGTASTRLRTIQGLLVWSHRARALDRSFGPEFIWCGNLKPAGFPALWVNRRVGTPYGIFLYGTELLLLQHRVKSSPRKRVAARMALRHAAVLVAVSDWTRRLCLEVLDGMGLPSGAHDVRTMHLGTDPVHFTTGVDPAPIRARYGLGEGRWLLTVARLAAHKGIDVGLKALAALRPTHPDLGYAIVGRGARQAELESLARALGVADRVRFLTDVPDADLPGLYNAAEIYLGLSRAEELMIEGFGIAQTEASACGLPVVGGRSGGIPDAVRHGETGLLVDSTDVGAVVGAIGTLLDDRDLAGRLGRGGRAAVESHYNWDRVTDDVRRIGGELGARSALARLHPWRLTSS